MSRLVIESVIVKCIVKFYNSPTSAIYESDFKREKKIEKGNRECNAAFVFDARVGSLLRGMFAKDGPGKFWREDGNIEWYD